MTAADLLSFLVGFAAIWAGLGLYLLYLHRRTRDVEDVVARLEVHLRRR